MRYLLLSLAYILTTAFTSLADLRTHLPTGFHGGDNGRGEYLIVQAASGVITGISGNVIMLCENSDPAEEPNYELYFTITIDNFTSLRRGRKTFLKANQVNGGDGTSGSLGSIEIAIMSGFNARQVPVQNQGQAAIVSITSVAGTQSCGATTVFNLIPGRTARKWLTTNQDGAYAALMRVGQDVGYFVFALPMSCVSNTGQYLDLVQVGGEWVRRSLRVDGSVNTYTLTDAAGGTGTYTMRLARDGTVEITGERTAPTGHICNGIMVLQTVRR